MTINNTRLNNNNYYHPISFLTNQQVLVDPYAKVIGRDVTWDDSLFPYNLWSSNPDKDLEINNDDNAAFCPLGAVVDNSFTWGNDTPPNIPWHKTVIYETHIKSLSYLHPGMFARA